MAYREFKYFKQNLETRIPNNHETISALNRLANDKSTWITHELSSRIKS